MSVSNAYERANHERFDGTSSQYYDDNRPAPPEILTEILTRYINTPRPALVVDLGSGTGLSTRLWAEHADKVIGVEPGADMRQVAMNRTSAANVSYVAGMANATGLDAESADLVTASQSFHWMEPVSTLQEAARILRPGGLFAAIDCNWPPLIHPEAEQVYDAVHARAKQIGKERGLTTEVRHFPKDKHRDSIESSGHFSYVREILLHKHDMGNAARLMGVSRSQGDAATCLNAGVSDAELGLDVLEEVADRVIGSEPVPWLWSYFVRFGVK
jgi:ubiquinone/menaquinone biosynthesis C-methylase UbiE